MRRMKHYYPSVGFLAFDAPYTSNMRYQVFDQNTKYSRKSLKKRDFEKALDYQYIELADDLFRDIIAVV
jgi:hypothetical protein